LLSVVPAHTAAESLIAAAPARATGIEVGVDERNHDAAEPYRRLRRSITEIRASA
jgi:hypothetical protein